MYIATIATVVVLMAHPSAMSADWTRQDTMAEAAVLASLYCDWSQTRQIAADPILHERNPLLGRHPSAGEVNRYFIGAAMTHVALAYMMKPKARRIFQGATIALELGCIANNYQLNVRVKF